MHSIRVALPLLLLGAACVLSINKRLDSLTETYQRCQQERNSDRCRTCCQRADLTTNNESVCYDKCHDMDRANMLLLTCTNDVYTCSSCCVQALAILTHRPDLLPQCQRNCQNAMALEIIG